MFSLWDKQKLSLSSLKTIVKKLTKFIAGSFTKSSSMISEGIHSTVDTVNRLLILYGLKRSKKLLDQFHPFGYGKRVVCKITV